MLCAIYMHMQFKMASTGGNSIGTRISASRVFATSNCEWQSIASKLDTVFVNI